jgi:hypothetical protein
MFSLLFFYMQYYLLLLARVHNKVFIVKPRKYYSTRINQKNHLWRFRESDDCFLFDHATAFAD